MFLFWLLCFSVWLATQNHSTLVTDTTVVPFLPVNPEYSSTRNQARITLVHQCYSVICNHPEYITSIYLGYFFNIFFYFSQGRQKLARFSAHEFATLVIDILTDAKRRQWGNSCESPKGGIFFSKFFVKNQRWLGWWSSLSVKSLISSHRERGTDPSGNRQPSQQRQPGQRSAWLRQCCVRWRPGAGGNMWRQLQRWQDQGWFYCFIVFQPIRRRRRRRLDR